jgi:hypothetical protein
LRKFAVVHLGRRLFPPKPKSTSLIEGKQHAKKELRGISTQRNVKKEKPVNLDAAMLTNSRAPR